MNIGFSLLTKLGLSSEEAEEHKNDKPSDAITIYAKDQTGIGYEERKSDFILQTDAAFAKLRAARVGVTDKKNNEEKLETKPSHQRFFIPSRLKKKSTGSLSNEDLAVILAKPEASTVPVESIKDNTEENQEGERKRRRKHRKHHEEEETEQK